MTGNYEVFALVNGKIERVEPDLFKETTLPIIIVGRNGSLSGRPTYAEIKNTKFSSVEVRDGDIYLSDGKVIRKVSSVKIARFDSMKYLSDKPEEVLSIAINYTDWEDFDKKDKEEQEKEKKERLLLAYNRTKEGNENLRKRVLELEGSLKEIYDINEVGGHGSRRAVREIVKRLIG